MGVFVLAPPQKKGSCPFGVPLNPQKNQGGSLQICSCPGLRQDNSWIGGSAALSACWIEKQATGVRQDLRQRAGFDRLYPHGAHVAALQVPGASGVSKGVLVGAGSGKARMRGAKTLFYFFRGFVLGSLGFATVLRVYLGNVVFCFISFFCGGGGGSCDCCFWGEVSDLCFQICVLCVCVCVVVCFLSFRVSAARTFAGQGRGLSLAAFGCFLLGRVSLHANLSSLKREASWASNIRERGGSL